MSVCNHGNARGCEECKGEWGTPTIYNKSLKEYSENELKRELKNRKSNKKQEIVNKIKELEAEINKLEKALNE